MYTHSIKSSSINTTAPIGNMPSNLIKEDGVWLHYYSNCLLLVFCVYTKQLVLYHILISLEVSHSINSSESTTRRLMVTICWGFVVNMSTCLSLFKAGASIKCLLM